MGDARTTVLVAVGPGARPDGWREVLARRAARLDARLRWAEAADEPQLAAALRSAPATCDAVVVTGTGLARAASAAEEVHRLPVPAAWAEPDRLDAAGPLPAACDRIVHGRGRRSFSGALAWAVHRVRHPARTLRYGAGPVRVGDLRLPTAASGPAPVAVLLHGGFFLDPWERDLMDGLAVHLTGRGWATWNVEYRRLGPTGGGWPATWVDACAAVDAVAGLARDHAVDPSRCVLVGHSAGATLALYTAVRSRLDTAPGEPPRVAPRAIVALAGLLDLEAAAHDALGDGAVTACLGDPDRHPDRYALACPRRRVPLGVPSLLVHGRDDRLVPVSHSEAMAAAARAAGDDVALELVEADHFAVVDPDGPATSAVDDRLADVAGSG